MDIQSEQNTKIKSGTKTGRTKDIKEQEQFRVIVSKESNAALEEFLRKANTDYKGGQITRSDVANFVFTKLNSLLNESDIKILQMQCFDDKDALVTLGKSEAELPEIVKQALREAYGLVSKEKKRSAKPNTELSTSNLVDN